MKSTQLQTSISTGAAFESSNKAITVYQILSVIATQYLTFINDLTVVSCNHIPGVHNICSLQWTKVRIQDGARAL